MKKSLFLLPILLLLLTSCQSIDKAAKTEKKQAKLPPLTDAEKQVIAKLGGKVLPNQDIKLGKITIHRRENELSFPAKMCITEAGEYGIEVLISLKSGRVHEALMVTEIDPMTLQFALYLIGAENGARMGLPGIIEQGSLINIDVETAKGNRLPVEDWLFEIKSEETMKRTGWVFVGSSYAEGGVCLAKVEGNIVNVLSMGNTILDNPNESGDAGQGLGVNTEAVPAKGTPVTVYLSLAKKDEM